MRISLIAVCFAALIVPAVCQAASTPAPKVNAQEAYFSVIGWGMGYGSEHEINANRARISDVNERVEREAYRYGIIKEFGMAVVSAEAYFAPKVSYARADSWSIYEKATGRKMSHYPDVMTDLDTSLSTLVAAMQKGKTVEQVLTLYWCGPNKSMNTDTLPQFITYVNKIYNGLEPFARQRLQAERSRTVKPAYSDYFEDDGWGGDAVANRDGFKSKLGARPLHADELERNGHFDSDYAAQVRNFNKSISAEDALLISRAILTYCHRTNWEVDPRMVMAVVAAESAFRPNAVSGVGALGLGQLMPATARAYGVNNPFDPLQNLYGTIKYIEREQHRWGKNPKLIFAAYNAGPGAVMKYGGVPPYRETQNYVVTVKKYYNRFCS